MPKTNKHKKLRLPLVLPFSARVATYVIYGLVRHYMKIEDTSLYKDFMLQNEEYEAKKAAEKKKES